MLKFVMLAALLMVSSAVAAQPVTYIVLINDTQEDIVFFNISQAPVTAGTNVLTQPLPPNEQYVFPAPISNGSWNFYCVSEDQYGYQWEGVQISYMLTVNIHPLYVSQFPVVLAPPPTQPPSQGSNDGGDEDDESCSTGSSSNNYYLALLAAVPVLAYRAMRSRQRATKE